MRLAHCSPQVFESGSMYSPSVLDITEEDLLSKVKTGIANITALSLQTHYPTEVCPRCFLISTVSVKVALVPGFVQGTGSRLVVLLERPSTCPMP